MQVDFQSSKQIENEFISSIKTISTFVSTIKECGIKEKKLKEIQESSCKLKESIKSLGMTIPDIKDEHAVQVLNGIISEKKEQLKRNKKTEKEFLEELVPYKQQITEYIIYIEHVARLYGGQYADHTFKAIADNVFKNDDFIAFAFFVSARKTRDNRGWNLYLEGSTPNYEILREANKGFDSFMKWVKEN